MNLAESRRLGRRDFLVLGAGAFAVSLVPLAAWQRHQVVRRTVPLMGTIAEVAVVHGDVRTAHAAIDAALDELSRVERTMTRFSPTSDVGRANRLAATRPVPVSASTAAVVRDALAWAQTSDGAFDPAIGRAIELWDVGQRRTPPPGRDVGRLAGRGLYRALDVDAWRGAPALRFTDPDVEIDLGGIAKGYGVDRAVDALRRHGVTQAIVNVGGDLYALGESERGEPWRIGIQSPDDPRRVAGTLAIRDAAVATSGDYFRYFDHGGRRYHHILDPDTATPWATGVHSVSVMADTCIAADAAATAVYGMAAGRAERLLSTRAPGARVVHVLGARAAVSG